MKACVLQGINHFVHTDVPDVSPRAGEALVQVKACGICSSDLVRVLKTGAYQHPRILGHEIAGKITALGEGANPDLLGSRVVVFPLKPCMKCDSCEQGHYAQCDDYDYFGSRCDGGFAELISVPLWNLMPIPENISYEAAALLEPAAVAYHAVKLLRDALNIQSVAIVGTGTIGILCGYWARRAGLSVLFASRNVRKTNFLKQRGFTCIVDDRDNVNITDACIECVGTASAIQTAIGMVKSRGHVILVGNPESAVMQLEKSVYWKILRSELTLRGSWNSSYPDDWRDSLEYMGEYSFEELITHRFALVDAMDAIKTLTDKDVFSLKGVFYI